MIAHSELGSTPFGTSRKLKLLINGGAVLFGGNKKLKIYGTLSCRSGRRMRITNRVFFASQTEAIEAGYRPCGNCMRAEYLFWKSRAG